MAEDMVAHVAQAIEEAALVWLTTPENFDKENAPPEVLARAAIEAMRTPTMPMLEAGNHAVNEHIDFYNYDSGAGYTVEPQAAFSTINAMIDVALSPPPD